MGEEKVERYSYSKISSFHSCIYDWYLSYIKKDRGDSNIYGVLGSQIHESYELMTQGKRTKEEAIDSFDKAYKKCIKDGLTFPTPKSGEKYYKDIIHAFETFENFKDKEMLQELEFNYTFCGLEFRGFIDLVLIDHKDKTIQILDWKSSSKFSKKELESEKVFQLILYSMVIKDTLGKEYKDYKILNPVFYMLKYCKIKSGETGKLKTIERCEITDEDEYIAPLLIEVQYNSKMIEKLKQYVIDTYFDISFKDIDDENDWIPEDINTFFCKNLCKRNCKYYKQAQYRN